MRTIRAVLIVIILQSGLSAPAADFAGGTGEPNDPYQIATAEQLVSIGSDSDLLDKHYVLLNDIDLDPNRPGGQVFARTLIASLSSPGPDRQPVGFTGSFDGHRHIIRNMVILAPPSIYTGYEGGLFGLIGKGGMVKDLRIEAADIQVHGDCVGILAGENAGCVLNCQVGGSVCGPPMQLDPSDVGGLVGWNRGDIVNCLAEMKLVWGFQCAGGLVGTNDREGRITGCRAVCKDVHVRRTGAGGLVGGNLGYVVGSYATGGILGWDFSVGYGGLVGSNGGVIINCYADSTVSAWRQSSHLGGLVGTSWGSVLNCYASGSVSTQDRCRGIGGLIGENRGSLVNSYAYGMISTDVGNEGVGGLAGAAENATIADCYFLASLDGGGPDNGLGTSLTDARMRQQASFVNWDFEDTWTICEGWDYPRLQWEGLPCAQ